MSELSQNINWNYFFKGLDFNSFFEKYWNQDFLLSKFDKSISETLNTAELNRLLTTCTSVDETRIQITKLTGEMPPQYFTKKSLNGGQVVDLSVMKTLIERRYTCLMRSLEDRSSYVSKLCHALQDYFSCPVSANLFMTPQYGQASPPHIDSGDVIVMQLYGKKEWLLYEKTTNFKLDYDNDNEPKHRLILEAGDILYVPQGLKHCARTEDYCSVHISFNIHHIDVLKILEKALKQETFAHHRMPPFSQFQSRQALVKELKEFLCNFVDEKLNDDLLQKVQQECTESLTQCCHTANILEFLDPEGTMNQKKEEILT